jgi:2-polyprenyl-3-methyl-5-hydroxy-6-metoxy-1,4-benzoquinol methylase
MIDVARQNVVVCGYEDNVMLAQNDILKYEDERGFDLIICVGVISHVNDAQLLMERIWALLMPNGRALIQFSNIDHFRYKLKRMFGTPDAYGYNLNTFNSSSFMELTSKAGLKFLAKKGYTWQYPIFDRLKATTQLRIIDSIRNTKAFSFLNSEWLVLFEKKSDA